MNELLINAGDIIKLNIDNEFVINDIEQLNSIIGKLWCSKNDFLKSEFEITSTNEKTFFVKKGNREYCVDTKNKTVESMSSSDNFVYGFIVSVYDSPFVIYFDGLQSQMKSYASVSNNVINIYRTYLSENEMFIYRMIKGYVIHNHKLSENGLVVPMYSIASEMPGNSCLNYIYIVLSINGMDTLPQSWAETGAPEDMVKIFAYGLSEVYKK